MRVRYCRPNNNTAKDSCCDACGNARATAATMMIIPTTPSPIVRGGWRNACGYERCSDGENYTRFKP
jgi:hypothetical protein